MKGLIICLLVSSATAAVFPFSSLPLPTFPPIPTRMPAFPTGLPTLPPMPQGLPTLPPMPQGLPTLPPMPQGLPTLPPMPQGLPTLPPMPQGLPTLPPMPTGIPAFPTGLPTIPTLPPNLPSLPNLITGQLSYMEIFNMVSAVYNSPLKQFMPPMMDMISLALKINSAANSVSEATDAVQEMLKKTAENVVYSMGPSTTKAPFSISGMFGRRLQGQAVPIALPQNPTEGQFIAPILPLPTSTIIPPLSLSPTVG